ncbi:MAG TPA: hypothetical protein VFL17_12865, partial [Anaerolineae bacterium]|nr:hypothetical protein [Anaerolineae bacterium]
MKRSGGYPESALTASRQEAQLSGGFLCTKPIDPFSTQGAAGPLTRYSGRIITEENLMSENELLTKALTDTILTRRSFLKWSGVLGG